MKRILIVDDEPSLIKGLRFNLEQQDGYTVDEALDGELCDIGAKVGADVPFCIIVV